MLTDTIVKRPLLKTVPSSSLAAPVLLFRSCRTEQNVPQSSGGYRTLRPQDTSAPDRGKLGILRTQDNSDETLLLHRCFDLKLVPKCPDTSAPILWC